MKMSDTITNIYNKFIFLIKTINYISTIVEIKI